MGLPMSEERLRAAMMADARAYQVRTGARRRPWNWRPKPEYLFRRVLAYRDSPLTTDQIAVELRAGRDAVERAFEAAGFPRKRM